MVGSLSRTVVLALIIGACRKPVPVVQPMAFNHALHMEADLKCLSCHPGGEDEMQAGFPALVDCLDCHGKPEGSHPDEPKIREFHLKKQEIPWIRVNRLPGHVYFSHAAHVTLAKMECRDCHQGILSAKVPLVFPDANLTMADCMACHREKKASNDCNVCHK